MPLINFSGIASGIDSESLIKATSDATRATQVTPQENKVKDLQDTNDALTKFKSSVVALQGIIRNFSSASGGVVQKKATSATEEAVSASASGVASNGSFSITVHKLATAGSWSSFNENGPTDYKYPSTSTPINSNITGTQQITCTIGDQAAFTVDVTNTTTLSAFVDDFNTKTTKAYATLTNVGTTAAPDYRVIINARETGATTGAVTISVPPAISDPDGMPGSGDERWNSNGGVIAQDAEFEMSGISTIIKRSNNTFSDIMPGVTVTLKEESPDPVTITISNDISGTAQKIKEFINKYNEVVSFIQENNQVITTQDGSTTTNTFTPLSLTRIDDNFITSMRSVMTQSSYYNTGNPNTATNAIWSFADIGITINSGPYDATTKKGGGTLDFNEATYVATATTVRSGFTDAMNTESDSINQIFMKFGDNAGNTRQRDGTTIGVIESYVRFDGLIDSAVTSNKNSIKDINSRIARAEAAISRNEETMRARFARLESTIGQMQNQQSALTSALSSLPRLS